MPSLKSSIQQKIKKVIRDLKRCVKQNEIDAECEEKYWCNARAVAGEQRRMIKILQELIKELPA